MAAAGARAATGESGASTAVVAAAAAGDGVASLREAALKETHEADLRALQAQRVAEGQEARAAVADAERRAAEARAFGERTALVLEEKVAELRAAAAREEKHEEEVDAARAEGMRAAAAAQVKLGNMREATAAAHRSAEVRLQQLAGQQLKALEEFDARLGRARDARDRAKEAQRKAEGETAVWRVCATTALAEVRRGEDEPTEAVKQAAAEARAAVEAAAVQTATAATRHGDEQRVLREALASVRDERDMLDARAAAERTRLTTEWERERRVLREALQTARDDSQRRTRRTPSSSRSSSSGATPSSLADAKRLEKASSGAGEREEALRQRVAELERARDDALREQDRVGGDATAVTAELNAAKREIDDLNREMDSLRLALGSEQRAQAEARAAADAAEKRCLEEARRASTLAAELVATKEADEAVAKQLRDALSAAQGIGERRAAELQQEAERRGWTPPTPRKCRSSNAWRWSRRARARRRR